MSHFLSKLPHWLTHDDKKFHYKNLILVLIFLFLPNTIFLLGAYLIGLARPIINVDYFWVCLLWVMPYRILRHLGTIIFVVLVIMDATMMAMQLFPFLDFAAAMSLAPFLFNAPVRYLVLVMIVMTYLCLMPMIMLKVSKRWFDGKFPTSILVVITLGFLSYYKFHELQYIQGNEEQFAQSDYFYIHSQYKRYRSVSSSDFIINLSTAPKVIPVEIAHISFHFGVPKNKISPVITRPLVINPSDKSAQLGDFGIKLPDDVVKAPANRQLLIVAESWGVARDPKVQREILAGIYGQADHLAFLDTGYFGFSGATVAGELRELCQLSVEEGYAFSRLDEIELKGCLPNQLKNQGYHTIGMHAGYSAIYERDFLYPKMGFTKTIFAETLSDKKRCSPFNGICDSEMFGEVVQAFAKHDKLFFYWLTLTSHSPFSTKDLHNPRLDCQKYELPTGDICNNFRLNAQFFDGLGQILTRPEMKGVEVIVVGDHMPPVMRNGAIHPYIQWQDVSWVHFKIKD